MLLTPNIFEAVLATTDANMSAV